jgi:hypothetical protein
MSEGRFPMNALFSGLISHAPQEPQWLAPGLVFGAPVVEPGVMV